MIRYRIEIDSIAQEDIDQSLAWLMQRNPDMVGDWLDALESKIYSLETNPERCPSAPENGRWGNDIEIQQLLFSDYPSKYRILYTVLGKTVRILQVRHTSRGDLFHTYES